MTDLILSFPPYEVRYSHHPERLETRITLAGAANREIVVMALAFDFVADTTTRQLFFHTANSDHPDAATVYSVDLETGDILWKVPDVQPGGQIVLHPDDRFLEAGKPYGTGDSFIVRVSYDGKVIERNPRNGYELLRWAEVNLEKGHDIAARSMLVKALTTAISPNTKAKALRHLGEIAERAGDSAAAVSYYQKALEFNPRAEVKKRIAQLVQSRSVKDGAE